MAAVLLACASAALFGSMTVALRLGLRRTPDVTLATLATLVPALAVAVVAAALDSIRPGPLGVGNAWPFLLAGLLAPGASQILFTLAVREAGPSRTSVAVGMAPLVAVAIAITALGEPVKAPLLAGALLIVAGGLVLVNEPGRPDHIRRIGLAYAFVATFLFASRDNLVRRLSEVSGAAEPGVAAAATLLTATVIAAIWLASGGIFLRHAPQSPRSRLAVAPEVVRRSLGGVSDTGSWLAFLPAGLFFGLSYVCLFEAYYRARVTVVAPLVAMESLWGVLLSAVILRRTELVGRRLIAGAVLVVAGGALIGAFR